MMNAAGRDGFVQGFPADFGWGASTAAYQIEGAVDEGGRGPSIWDVFSHEPGRTAAGETGDVSCDHYHLWQEDIERMSELGLGLYRFSIAWPRVMPAGRGPLNEQGVDFYNRLIDGLLERGIEPFPTLYHWDLPQALQEEGGWEARDTAKRFAEYAALMFERLGDRVEMWQTHNEPWVTAFMGYVAGEKAPGIFNDWPRALRVSHHLLLSHGLAVQALRDLRPGAKIGIALNLHKAEPLTESPEDRAAADFWDGFENRWFLDPVFKGAYPADMLEIYAPFGIEEAIESGDLQIISAPTDLLGINVYTRALLKHQPGSVFLDVLSVKTSEQRTEMDWEVLPDSLYDVLLRLKRDYGDVDLYITENGAAFRDTWDGEDVVEDPDRLDYIARHLEALSRAMAEGVNVKGYCVWSLLDNYEWEKGYAKRFGLYYVDYPTQRRIPKRSALWYRDQIAVSRGNG